MLCGQRFFILSLKLIVMMSYDKDYRKNNKLYIPVVVLIILLNKNLKKNNSSRKKKR